MKASYDIRGNEMGINVIVYGTLTAGALIVLFPLFYVLMASFAPEVEYLTRGFFIFPKNWTLEGYLYLLSNAQFGIAFKNAAIISSMGTAINIVMTTLMAYGLSKKWIKGRNVLNFMVIFTMLFSGGLIPTYLIVKSLGLINSFWAIWLVSAIAPFNLIVMRSFFQSIPQELEESARMDGCGEWKMLFSIILPLSMPAIATFTLFYLVHNWNTYFPAVLYLNDTSKFPLQVYLRQMLIEESTTMVSMSEAFKFTPASRMAAIILTAFPLLVIYPFLQKYFNKGMLLGSVKG